MKEGDPIARGYNFNKITGDSERELARQKVITELSGAYDRSEQCTLDSNRLVESVVKGISLLTNSVNPYVANIAKSEAYDSFESESGIEIESSIICLDMGSSPWHKSKGIMTGIVNSEFMNLIGLNGQGNADDKIFLLAATAKGQVEITENNLKYGAVQLASGVTGFFKLCRLGEVPEENRPVPLRAILASGIYNEQMEAVANDILIAVAVDPMEEQMLSQEFAKASETLNSKADEKEARLRQAQEFTFIYPGGNPSELLQFDKQVISPTTWSAVRVSSQKPSPSDTGPLRDITIESNESE